MKVALVPLATLLLFVSAGAWGADSPPTSNPAAKSPPASDQPAKSAPTSDRAAICGADIDKFCANVQQGKGHIARCLKRNESKLSPECKDVVAQARTNRKSTDSAKPKG